MRSKFMYIILVLVLVFSFTSCDEILNNLPLDDLGINMPGYNVPPQQEQPGQNEPSLPSDPVYGDPDSEDDTNEPGNEPGNEPDDPNGIVVHFDAEWYKLETDPEDDKAFTSWQLGDGQYRYGDLVSLIFDPWNAHNYFNEYDLYIDGEPVDENYIFTKDTTVRVVQRAPKFVVQWKRTDYQGYESGWTYVRFYEDMSFASWIELYFGDEGFYGITSVNNIRTAYDVAFNGGENFDTLSTDGELVFTARPGDYYITFVMPHDAGRLTYPVYSFNKTADSVLKIYGYSDVALQMYGCAVDGVNYQDLNVPINENIDTVRLVSKTVIAVIDGDVEPKYQVKLAHCSENFTLGQFLYIVYGKSFEELNRDFDIKVDGHLPDSADYLLVSNGEYDSVLDSHVYGYVTNYVDLQPRDGKQCFADVTLYNKSNVSVLDQSEYLCSDDTYLSMILQNDIFRYALSNQAIIFDALAGRQINVYGLSDALLPIYVNGKQLKASELLHLVSDGDKIEIYSDRNDINPPSSGGGSTDELKDLSVSVTTYTKDGGHSGGNISLPVDAKADDAVLKMCGKTIMELELEGFEVRTTYGFDENDYEMYGKYGRTLNGDEMLKDLVLTEDGMPCSGEIIILEPGYNPDL